MGWTFMEKPADVRGYLDAMYTWTNDGVVNRVIDSAIVGRTTYYCAVETVKPDGARSVWAGVAMLKFAPRARDGLTFGYKDLAESAGPFAWACPLRILELLTDTDSEYANNWRAKVREYHARRSALPKLVEGMKLRILNESVPTVNGIELREVSVIRAGRKPLFTVAGFGGYFRWPSWRQYQVEAA